MKKVLCIAQGRMFGEPQGEWKIEFMEEYDVLHEHELYGFPYYELSHQPGFAYAAEHFVVMPSLEEVEEATWEDREVRKMDALMKGLADFMPVIPIDLGAYLDTWNRIDKILRP